MAKIALIPGHNWQAKGAVAVANVIPDREYPWACGILQRMADRLDALGHEHKIIIREPKHGGYGQQMEKVAQEVNKWGADLAYELHFNASNHPSACGSEVLYWHTSMQGRASAIRLIQNDVETLGVKAREPLGRKKGERGTGLMRRTKCATVLGEPFFGSNEQDCAKWAEHEDEWVNATARCIDEICREVLQL